MIFTFPLPEEPTHELLQAMSESVAITDEGEYLPLCDIIDCSGENLLHNILRAAYLALISEAKGDHQRKFDFRVQSFTS
ncbi:hypothetical protein [Caulobacter phage Cr30]|uniref:hypothetical protein n=1 Tax=Caulobacter phage Cr30 TaxID=1357714 RepID=UPI0004A9B91A|nr:hypothetical protein OZ74_gp078 [Caulobacter phage Cr30]AGS80963.1 hypothetical protein [Caulobacter phage Cr30]